jgi:hypothetical protein
VGGLISPVPLMLLLLLLLLLLLRRSTAAGRTHASPICLSALMLMQGCVEISGIGFGRGFTVASFRIVTIGVCERKNASLFLGHMVAWSQNEQIDSDLWLCRNLSKAKQFRFLYRYISTSNFIFQ